MAHRTSMTVVLAAHCWAVTIPDIGAGYSGRWACTFMLPLTQRQPERGVVTWSR
jgi:hypothetical protein